MKRFFFFVLLIFAGLWAVLFFRLPIMGYLLQRALIQTGATHIVLELADVSLQELQIQHLDCTWPQKGARLSLENSLLTWDRSVLFDKQLNTLSIPSLRLTLPSSPPLQTAKKPTMQQRVQQLSHLPKQLPCKHISIKQLVLWGQAAGPLAGQDLTLNMDDNKGLPTATLHVQKPELQLAFNTLKRHRWQVKGYGKENNTPMMSAAAEVKNNQLQMSFHAELNQLQQLTPLLPEALTEIRGELSGTMGLQLAGAIQTELKGQLKNFTLDGITGEDLHVLFKGSIDNSGSTIRLKGNTLTGSKLKRQALSIGELYLSFDALLQHQDKQWLGWIQFGKKSSIRYIENAALHIRALELAPMITGTYSPNSISLNLELPEQGEMKGIHIGSLNISTLGLHTEQRTSFTLQPGQKNNWSIAPVAWNVVPGAVQIGKQGVTTSPLLFTLLQADGTVNSLRAETTLRTERIQLSTKKNGITLFNATAGITMQDHLLQGKISFIPETVPGSMSGHFRHDVKTGRGSGSLDSGAGLHFSTTSPLSSLVHNWPLAADLTAGQLQIKTYSQWQPRLPLTLNLKVELSGGQGNIGAIPFTGLSSHQDLEVLPRIRSRRPGNISMAAIDPGFPLTNLTTSLSLQPSVNEIFPVAELHNFSAAILGGTISNKVLTVNPAHPEFNSTLTLRNIDLARLMALHTIKGLVVEGKINGTLPLHYANTEIRMSQGVLTDNGSGGRICYTVPNDNGLQQSPLTGYALKALEDFQYDILSATVDYKPTGLLLIHLQLQGKSPKLETNRAVHLNLNIEQNILSLLRSLRYSKSLTDTIDQDVQHHFQKSAQ